MNTLITELTWWQLGLLGIYALYTLIRAFWIFNSGLREATIGEYNKDIRLYHVIWAIIDIPAIALGMLFPILKKLFGIRLVRLKK